MGEVPDREDGTDAGDELGDAAELDDLEDVEDDGELDDESDGGDDAERGRGARERVADLPRLEPGALIEILEFLAKSLVAEPDKVAVDMVDREGGVTLRLSVDQPDMGKVIGRSGRTARAIRTLMRAAGTRAGIHTYVEIVEA
jgi:uncharacterized protein